MAPLNIPMVRQSYDYSCGAACVASLLYYWGVWEGREPELYEALGTTEQGTSGSGIMEVLVSYGLEVSYESGMTIERLRELSKEGYTVILNIQAWLDRYEDILDWDMIWEDGHYVVLVGLKGDLVYMMDPGVAIRYGVMEVNEFEKRWHDWSDDGETQEYHCGIIVKGKNVLNTNELVKIT